MSLMSYHDETGLDKCPECGTDFTVPHTDPTWEWVKKSCETNSDHAVLVRLGPDGNYSFLHGDPTQQEALISAEALRQSMLARDVMRARLEEYRDLAQTISNDNDGLWLGDSPDDYAGHIAGYIGKLEARVDNQREQINALREVLRIIAEQSVDDLAEKQARAALNVNWLSK